MRLIRLVLAFLFLIPGVKNSADNWPTIHHDVARSGRTADEVRGPYAKRWVRFFPGEIMTTRLEAIVAEGRVFVGTYSGNLYALNDDSGETLWKFAAGGPILHSPAVDAGVVFFGCEDGFVRALDAKSGRPIWRAPEKPVPGGFDTSPAVFKGRVLLGARNGVFYAMEAKTGAVKWTVATGGPIRTSAACANGKIVFASDDMHAYCADARGALLWKSPKLNGQSLRDYYPVVIGDAVVLRSIPAGPYAERHGRDRDLLMRHAGVVGGWQETDKFLKSDATRGTLEKLESERRLVLDQLEKTPDARTFFVLDGATGKERDRVPVMYAAGCQGTGFPPVLTNDGRIIVFYRSAFTNWSLGVAPVVAMGYLDLKRQAVEPIRHTSGNAPPWNTFWGTADESQNFAVGGNTLYICHQGTISGLDLKTHRLFPIAGNRDTWGGETGLPWARNEWHGPARGSAVLCGKRIYWLTGSRVICVEGEAKGGKPADKPFDPASSDRINLEIPEPAPGPNPGDLVEYVWQSKTDWQSVKSRTGWQPVNGGTDRQSVKSRTDWQPVKGGTDWQPVLQKYVSDFLDSDRLAPLYVQTGLAGHEYFFDSSADVVRALSLAYLHLSKPLQERVRSYLAAETRKYPLWDARCYYPIAEGKRRELFNIPDGILRPQGHPRPHPLGNLYALWLYADRTGDATIVKENWDAIRACYAGFVKSGWDFDPSKGDVFANRYIAGLIGYARLARAHGDETCVEAANMARLKLIAQLKSFQFGLKGLRPPAIRSVSEVDGFIGRGNSLFCGAHHTAKIAAFLGLEPEIAAAVRDHAPDAARAYLQVIDLMMPGWYLAGEERQVHFGENFMDYPDQAFSIFEAKALIERPGREKLERFLDIPWCVGDLYYIIKLVRLIES